MVMALTWIGILESSDPALVYHTAPAARAAYLVRLAAGLLMTAASIRWLASAASAAAAGELAKE